MALQDILQERLLKILSNADEVEPDLVAQVATEAEQIVGQRVLEQPFVLDIAIYRYILIKGTMSLEGFEEAYKEAIKRLSKAPTKPDDSIEDTEPSFGIKTGQRSAVWM